MEKNIILEKLNKNLKDFSLVENEISMVLLAMYQKNIAATKEDRLNKLRSFFEQQAIFYGQNSKKYHTRIDNNIKKYELEINKLINSYDKLYTEVFKIMQIAVNNQKIAIANIVTLINSANKENILIEEKQKLEANIIACAQKKLNYSIIIDECNERIKWCVKNAQIDINQVFSNTINRVEVFKESTFYKIKKAIYNEILGGFKYRGFLNDYERLYIKDIKLKNSLKILEVSTNIKNISKQMKKMQEQISENYTNAL